MVFKDKHVLYNMNWFNLQCEYMAEILLALYAPFKLFIEDENVYMLHSLL